MGIDFQHIDFIILDQDKIQYKNLINQLVTLYMNLT
jgi:predicted O-methyltransferase YrrM